jgi:hypothetical protein
MATAAEHSRRYHARRHDDEIVLESRCRRRTRKLQENEMVTERQKAFRQEYRSRIVGWYSFRV